MTLDPAELARLRELRKAATGGEWSSNSYRTVVQLSSGKEVATTHRPLYDADLIAAAVNALPALLDMAEVYLTRDAPGET